MLWGMAKSRDCGAEVFLCRDKAGDFWGGGLRRQTGVERSKSIGVSRLQTRRVHSYRMQAQILKRKTHGREEVRGESEGAEMEGRWVFILRARTKISVLVIRPLP